MPLQKEVKTTAPFGKPSSAFPLAFHGLLSSSKLLRLPSSVASASIPSLLAAPDPTVRSVVRLASIATLFWDQSLSQQPAHLESPHVVSCVPVNPPKNCPLSPVPAPAPPPGPDPSEPTFHRDSPAIHRHPGGPMTDLEFVTSVSTLQEHHRLFNIDLHHQKQS